MGRPKNPNRRDRQLNISLTSAELESIGARAQGHGMPPVEYSRWILLDQGKTTALPAAPAPRFDRLVYLQLSRLGNLLNQLVRHAHATDELLPELASLLADIRDILRKHVL
jgi:hypothetical protein